MSLATLYSPIDSPEAFEAFSFSNQDSHIKIVTRIFELTGIQRPTYLLHPFDPKDSKIWAQVHQQAHNDMNTILGIGGNDYTGVDWDDEDAVAAFINLHGNNHQLAEQILRIT